MTRAPFAAGLALPLLLLWSCSPNVTSLGEWIREQPDAAARDASAVRDATAPDATAPDAAVHTGRYLEAESGVLSGGFTTQDDATASGARSIAPPADTTSDTEPGAARAGYRFDVDTAATYLIWGRIHSPGVEHNRFWFQLDGGDWHKWRISTGDIWFWDALHEDLDYDRPLEFELAQGAHELVIANCVAGVDLDRLYVTADGDMPPGNDTACHPPHSIEVGGVCQQSCGSHGDTTCGADACADREIFSAYDCAVCCKAAL